MIEEDDLQRLLSDAAEAVPAPGRAPQVLLDAVAAQASVPAARHVPKSRIAAIAAAVVLVAAIGAATLDTGGSADLSSVAKFADTGSATGSLDSGGATSGGPVAAPEVAASSDERASAPIPDSAKIVKTGSLDLEVRKGAFAGAIDRITAKAIGVGGYIAQSTTNESSDRPSGSLTARVPAESFEVFVAELRKLGDVKAASVRGTDVTAQFTDLAARLSALSATRERLSAVLAEAKNVPDILAVQDRITTVQVEIEQLQGQQRVLADQTAFATLAVTVGEPGSAVIDTQPNDGLGKAWEDARRRFGDNLEAIVSWSGSAAAVLLVGLVLLGLGRLGWVGVRRRMV